MIEVVWKGGEHLFAFEIQHLRALQQKCDAGPQWICDRLQNGGWLVDDVIETIRLGLEGGGLEKTEARKLVQDFVENEPIAVSVLLAYSILSASIYGVADDPVGESEGEVMANKENHSPTESTDGQGSTPAAQ